MKHPLTRRPRYLMGLFAVAALAVAGCGTDQPDDPAAVGETTEVTTAGATQVDDTATTETTSADEASGREGTSGTGEPEPSEADPDVTEPPAGVDSEELLAGLEAAVVPLGDVLGVERPGSGEPSTIRVSTYVRLCPADDVTVSAVVQTDPLIENVAIERFFIVFDTPEEATAFAADLAGTEVGCEATRENEVAVSDITITSVEPVDVGSGSVQITAALALDMVNFDNNPPDRDVLRSVGHHDRTVVIVLSLADYATFIETDVHEPLLTDGLDIVKALS